MSETPEKQTTPVPPEPADNQPEPGFGLKPYAERLNGRFAMIGLAALLLIEIVTQQDLFTWLGLR